jgi:hypothetical protein
MFRRAIVALVAAGVIGLGAAGAAFAKSRKHVGSRSGSVKTLSVAKHGHKHKKHKKHHKRIVKSYGRYGVAKSR